MLRSSGLLSFAGSPVERRSLPVRVFDGYIVQHLGFQNKEAAVDESAVLVGFCPEAGDGVSARHQIEDTEAAGLMDRGEGRGGARCPVKVDQKIGRASCRERVCQYV